MERLVLFNIQLCQTQQRDLINEFSNVSMFSRTGIVHVHFDWYGWVNAMLDGQRLPLFSAMTIRLC
jgi:hypothetical protein